MARDDDLRVLLDRQHIYDVIVRYCRGVDRGDRGTGLSDSLFYGRDRRQRPAGAH